MAGSERTFTYTIKPEAEDVDRLTTKARKILANACDGDDRITCHDVGGDAVGVVTLTLTIRGRDQWESRQLAQDILNHVTWGLKNPAGLDLASERQPPHDHRGYAHGRTKRFRARRKEGT
jgi:hypothetical protein